MANLNPCELTRFQPGDRWTGNPGGRPKGRSLTAILRETLDGVELDGKPTKDGKSVAEKLVDALLIHAINGNASLIREVLDRVDGKVPDRLINETSREAIPKTLDDMIDQAYGDKPREDAGGGDGGGGDEGPAS